MGWFNCLIPLVQVLAKIRTKLGTMQKMALDYIPGPDGSIPTNILGSIRFCSLLLANAKTSCYFPSMSCYLIAGPSNSLINIVFIFLVASYEVV